MTEANLTLLRAHAHQWGPGKVHALTGDRTRCGKTRAGCPGDEATGNRSAITCGGCNQGLEADDRRRAQEREWAARQAEREEENRRWWQWYDNYLQTPQWHRRREHVLNRANGTCEGCREAPANHVHHLTYQRAGTEMLFDLVAICTNCYTQIHTQHETPNTTNPYDPYSEAA